MKKVQDSIGCDYTSVSDLLDKVNEKIKEYPHLTFKDFMIESELEYDCPVARVTFSRPETDKERAEREDYEKKNLEWRRQQYERLKKEFE